MKKTSAFLVIVLALISGCVSNQPQSDVNKPLAEQPSQNTPQDPAATQPDTQTASEVSSTGKLVFYRETALGLAVQPKVNVNGKVFGKSTPRRHFTCEVPAGSYEITTKTETTASLTVELKEAETAYIKMGIEFGVVVGRTTLQRVSDEVGETAISKLKQIETPPCGS